MKQKYKNYLGWAIKVGIAVSMILFLYFKLNNNKSIRELHQIAIKLDMGSVTFVLMGVVALMILNWLSEAYKWKILIKKIQPISYWTSVYTIICGISLGTITPGRIGDYGIRMMLLPPYKRVFGTIMLGMGVFAQIIMFNILASIAIPVFTYLYKPEYIDFVYVMLFASPAYITLLLVLYLNVGSLDKLIQKIGFLRRYRRFFIILSSYNRTYLLKIIGICFFRFFILVIQFSLLIHLLIPAITFAQVALMITLFYAIQSIIPTIDILNVGLRGITAIYLFGFITDQHTAIAVITTAIWLINLILPSLIGLVLIIRLPQNRNANWLKVSG
ncbi:lysylphosphatidylglycerol synthase domain-containing protein [Pedobacter sp. Du54]|uniref:lysylphosphatidylglycerol synthase domain-containing protein n=1 Tax=Pedobacter anseongensis TaxID=3133439 RepID=UPI00309D49EC